MSTEAERDSKCAKCLMKKWLLHSVNLDGEFQRLCTSCVLWFHRSSFCPTCFTFYHSSTLPNVTVCSQCRSFSHSHCVISSSGTHYLCPPCKDPCFIFFAISRNGDVRSIDTQELANSLHCAAQISLASIRKALSEARANVDTKVTQAALAKKQALMVMKDLG